MMAGSFVRSSARAGMRVRVLPSPSQSARTRMRSSRQLSSFPPSAVVPWPMHPVLNLDQQGEFEAVVHGSCMETRAKSAQLVLDNKRQAFLSELQRYSANSHAVFANSEFSLKYINVYGFDFDYTLAQYSKELHKFIYQQARDLLIKKLNYPVMMKDLEYDPEFAIRGLHCDSKNGILMKIDAYNHIQLSSVYRGHSAVSGREVLNLYGSLHVPMRDLDNVPTTSKWKLTQFLDMFSIPEATLYADVSQFLLQHSINYDPENLFEDVQSTIYDLHTSSCVHSEIASNLDRYLLTHHKLAEFLRRLKAAGKQLFIITNSPYWFVNKVLVHLLQSGKWQDLFDVIVVEAKKPSFYFESHRPFRCLNSDSMTPTWTKVTELVPGKVYQQGNVKDLVEMMKWQNKEVLYFGDHVFSDLADPILQQGWKTGAIIPELENEIECANSDHFKQQLSNLLALESMLKEQNRLALVGDQLEKWKAERDHARRCLKEAHNSRFGSVFRTEKSPTYFSRRLASFSNLYTSSLDNLLHYSLKHTFIPRRAALPHEPDLNFDL